ncbi:hypothetical protein H8B15_00170 [Hymenobacter sp. BT507]|uniref:LPXTG cell wall anchor domain-containing protein n=1 Tax=Hymenobacter citatus TaxID=2763506 RepID=A0ABR7MEF9_9BACT|nr:hypothetical protein [Hymenobacter citatus]MBC6609318.1 hypothetical protein [Hymenobacter citatus]
MKIVTNALRFAITAFLLTRAAAPAQASDILLPVPVQDCPPPTHAPIDGGASVLLAGGAAYMVRRIRKNK